MGVTVRWVKGSPAEFIGMGKKIETQLYAALSDAMAKVIVSAVADAKSRTDRVLTGAMISAIDGQVEARGREIIGKFGFIGEQADYFLYQTVTGFHHALSGYFIAPTFALRDAGEIAKGDVVAAVAAAIRSVTL